MNFTESRVKNDLKNIKYFNNSVKIYENASKYCKLNGEGGFLFTSVVKGYEGNSVFFPLSGKIDGDDYKFFKQYGWFWCNSLYTNPENQKLDIKSGSTMRIQHTDGIENHTIEGMQRSQGIPIRPVYKGEI